MEPYDEQSHIKLSLKTYYSNLTEDGVELFKKPVRNWWKAHDRGTSIEKITILEKGLEKIRNRKKIMETVKQLLLDFIQAMNKWELETSKVFHQRSFDTQEEYDCIEEQVKNKLIEIYSTYCTDRELKKKRGRLASLKCGIPPEYAIETQPIEKIEQINKNKYVVYTKQIDGFKHYLRYTIIFKNKEWKIDKKECFVKSEDKWENRSL